MRISAYLGAIAFLSVAAFGQTASQPKFEVADVHSSPHTSRPVVQGPFHISGRYELRFASMLDLVRMAYNVDAEKVLGGPSWLEMTRFDVFAKTPAGATDDSRAQMLQALLAERFHLVVHKDTKPVDAFVLTATKHPLMKEAAGSGEGGCSFAVQNTPGPPPGGGGADAPRVINLPVLSYTCNNTTMAAFAAGMLSIPGAAQYFTNRPVADKTGLQGSFDFVLRFTPKVPAGIQVTGENIPIFDALEKQLGLKLDASTIPLPVIVVDSVNQKPTENPPEVAKTFPPVPTEFEVAELKPSPPDTSGGRGGGRPPEIKNGRIYVPGITVKNLIQLAWDLNGNDMLVGAPKWMDDDRFDLIAKAPAGVALGDLTPQRAGVSINIEALRPMIRALIVDQFKLKFHTEDRPINTFTLTVNKPKLKQSDPASRTRWSEGAAPNSKNANAALGRLVTCQNVTMAQFAEMLPVIAPGYIQTHVADLTGLEGGWDFTFSFSPVGVLQLGGGGRGGDGGAPAGGAGVEASEPSGGLSLQDAMIKQLGLKLETQKRPTPVMVIDHVDRKSDN